MEFYLKYYLEWRDSQNSSILGWLRIKFHNLFRFTFYEVILISWSESQVWPVGLGW
jgi:hypothetical protein